MKILYYDCFAGISGDMNMAALLDAGVDESRLRSELAKLPLEGYELKVSCDNRKGIFGTRVDVILTNPHDHDHDHHHHHHPHRNLADIKTLISAAGYSPRVTELSLRIFQLIAEAEAKIHGLSSSDVHFHEVGAVDSIVDIVGAAICLDILNVDKIVSGPLELGGGFVSCAHGTFPVPAPATAEIVKGMPTRLGTIPHETTTPTGAAILAACADEFTDKPAMTITKTGYGIGHRDTDIPNVLRVFLGEATAKSQSTDAAAETMQVIECTIDDMNPELYDYVIELLRKRGAADAFLTQVIMKKSRPGVTITVICDPSQEETMTDILLRDTTTIGVRSYSVNRTILKREFSTVTTKYGDIRIKTSSYKGKTLRSKPEYDDCHRLATKLNIPITEIYKEVHRCLNR
jgi:uncharacterized protein (TIGR00299 family) protein